MGKIVEDSFPSFFFLFILFLVPSAKTWNFYSIPLLDSDDISWWKDSQLKSLGMAVVQRIHVGEGRKFRLILTRNEARLCYRSDGGGER